MFERLARQLAPSAAAASGRQRPPSNGARCTVFENYIKGLVAETDRRADSVPRGRAEARAGFAPARIALWQVYTAQGDHAQARDRGAGGARRRRVSHRRARFLVALSRIHLRQYDEAFQAA